MKKWMLALSLTGLFTAPALAAKTPRTVNEYFQAPVEVQGLLSPILFRAQALRMNTPTGPEWRMKISIRPDGVGFLWFFLTLPEAQDMLTVGQEYLKSSDEAKQSPADVYEKRVGISDELDMVYRRERDGGEEFWITRSGELAAQRSLVIDKGVFEALLRSIGIALEKAKANQK